MTTTLPQRKDYMDGRVSFAEFYRSVYQTAGIRELPSDLMDRVREALSAGDKHLNSIPLPIWDNVARAWGAQLSASFKKHGDLFSPAGGVCAMKQAARDEAEGC